MIEIKGKLNKAIVYTDNIDEGSISQIMELLNHYAFKYAKIRIMPDVHKGKGCVIGFSACMKDLVIPNLVGVDIGCGMLAVNLSKVELDLEELDLYIRHKIPHGMNVNSKSKVRLDKAFNEKLAKISKKTKGDLKRDLCSIGSLGGGNHFIEIAVDKDYNKYLIIHSGSRNLGQRIATYHQKIAIDYCKDMLNFYEKEKLEKIDSLKIDSNIENKNEIIKDVIDEIELLKEKYKVSKNLAFLEGVGRENYLEDMKFAQEYASLSRFTMAKTILEYLNLDISKLDYFESIHNYIDFESQIIRKGAISANDGEKVIIPINMRDGSIIATGKGNSNWNNSAPHGAGRILSRKQAKEELDMDNFKDSMKDIYSSCIRESTLDEAPMAYKSIDEIIKNTKDTIDIIDILKPIYNFKA